LNPRNAAPWGLAGLACVAIAMGFRSNETVPQLTKAARAEASVRAADVVLGASDTNQFDDSALRSDSRGRARAAAGKTPLGGLNSAALRRALFLRGEPGLKVTKDTTPAACVRVTPGALLAIQPAGSPAP